jgi:hypothetical protein
MRLLLLVSMVALVAASGALAGTRTGGRGPDRFDTVNGVRDTIRCGGGRDIVVADLKDVVSSDCETVTRRIALDTTTASSAQHRTIVEPEAAGAGNTVVTVYQAGRYVDGGAAAIGWASSLDGGATWSRGILADAGTDRISDPVVARDDVHGTWLAAALGVGAVTTIPVYASTTGTAWALQTIARQLPPPPQQPIGLDKDWLSCDNRPASQHRGTCYLAYTNLVTGSLEVQSSQDGGKTWSVAVAASPPGSDLGAIPVMLPDGTVVVVWVTDDLSTIEASTSADGGQSFSAPVVVTTLVSDMPFLRAPPLPSAAETATGVVVVWPDCSAHTACSANDIRLASSGDGKTWTAPVTVASGADYVTPSVGASGNSVAIVAYSRPDASKTSLGVRLFRSLDGGATWASPLRLDAQPMQISSLAQSQSDGIGGFLGDYDAVAFVGGRPVPVFAAAEPRVGNGFRQDLYATVRLP